MMGTAALVQAVKKVAEEIEEIEEVASLEAALLVAAQEGVAAQAAAVWVVVGQVGERMAAVQSVREAQMVEGMNVVVV